MAAVTICSDFGAQNNKVWHCFHCFPIYFPWSEGADAMILVFWKYIMRNAGLDEAQVGIKIARRNISNPRYAGDTTFMAESKKELKNLLMKVQEESEKVGLKLNI